MPSQKLSRRDLLRAIGLGSAALLAGNVLSAGAPEPPAAASIPATATATAGTPDVEIALKAVQGEVQVMPGAPTQVWRYQGEVLHGPS